MTTKYFMTDGEKSVPLSSLAPEAWTEMGTGTILVKDKKMGDLYSLVGIVNRCVTIRGAALSSMPWSIDDMSGNEIITSKDRRIEEEWKWLGDFTRNLFLLESSMVILSRSFLYEEPVTFKRNPLDPPTRLRWLSPLATHANWDKEIGIRDFTRVLGPGDERILPYEAVAYCWYPNPMGETDLAPSPVQAALQSANVIASLDRFAKQFFDRGAIKATILQVEGSTPPKERQKLKEWWERITTGIQNAWRTEVASSAVNPVVVGEGLAEIANTQITKDKASDVATNMGVPASLLFANAANYATASVDERNFYTYTITPDARLIEEEMNEKFFKPRGFLLTFHPEQLECFQESSVKRAQVVKILVDASMPLLESLSIAGVPISDEVKAKLEKLEEEKKQQQQAQLEAMQNNQNNPDPNDPNNGGNGGGQKPPQQKPASTKDEKNFRYWVKKRLSKGTKAVLEEFESDELTPQDKVDIAAEVLNELWDELPSEEIDVKGLILQANPDDDEEEVKIRLPVEEKVANIIAAELRAQAAEVLSGNEDKLDADPSSVDLGRLTGSPARIATSTGSARDALRQALIEGADLGVKTADKQFKGIGFGFDYTLVNQDARKWADTYSYELVRGIDETTQAHLRQSIRQWIDNGLPLRNLKRELAPIFGRDRAELIASTEVTRAYAEGNRIAYAASGVVDEIIWRTTMDERVCPVCGPLADKKAPLRTGFAGVKTGFPPAHPRCRCWIAPYIDVKAQAISVPEPIVEKDLAKKFFDAGNNELTPEEEKALRLYSGGSFSSINKALRTGKMTESAQRNVTLIDSAMDKQALQAGAAVYRYDSYEGIGKLAAGEIDKLDVKSYFSTAWKDTGFKKAMEVGAEGSFNSHYMEIVLKESIGAVSMKPISKHASEAEIVLDRNIVLTLDKSFTPIQNSVGKWVFRVFAEYGE